MKKIFTILLALAILSDANAQSDRKMGINNPNPKYTLDIEGSMRIGELGVSKEGAKLLAWDPDTGQVVFAPDQSIRKPFYHLIFTITIDNDPSEDWSHRANLGIDYNKYTVIVTQANLVSKNFSYQNPDAGKLMISAMTKEENSTASKHSQHAHIRNGVIKLQNLNEPDNANANNRFLGMSYLKANVFLDGTHKSPPEPLNGKYYRFEGDYDLARVTYIGSNTSNKHPTQTGLANKWIVSLLVMDNELVEQLK
ncbi:MAG: hypothetical protein Q4A00_05360 [Flavobacteriaceae bacterium]|nr:hypothetical protein [Flavobacteriaceae bacterium]